MKVVCNTDSFTTGMYRYVWDLRTIQQPALKLPIQAVKSVGEHSPSLF